MVFPYVGSIVVFISQVSDDDCLLLIGDVMVVSLVVVGIDDVGNEVC